MAPRVLVCVPVSPEQTNQIAAGRSLTGPLQVFAATPELLATFDLEPADDEAGEFAALLLASLWGLIHHGRRLVLTAMVDASALRPGAETDNGGLLLDQLPASRVEAWFSDDEHTPAAEVQAAIAGLGLDEAWERPQVQALLGEHDLAWHSVTELERD